MFDKDVLRLDPLQKLIASPKVWRTDSRSIAQSGAVVGISGGIDSSVVAALCVRAFGKEKVLGLFCPNIILRTTRSCLGGLLAEHFGIEAVVEDIALLLRGWVATAADRSHPHYRSRIRG